MARKDGKLVVAVADADTASELAAHCKVTHAGCLGQAGQLVAEEGPGWVLLDLNHCDAAEAYAWAKHLRLTKKVSVAYLLPDGQQPFRSDLAAAVFGRPLDGAAAAARMGVAYAPVSGD